MAEPRISLEQLKQLRIRSVVKAKQLPPPGRVVRLQTLDGKIYHVTGAKLSYRSGYTIVGDGTESVLLRTRSRLFLGTRYAALLFGWLLMVGLLTGLLAPKPGPDVAHRLDQLTGIQRSLGDLDEYIRDQRSTLATLSKDIQELEQERATLSEAAQLNRRQVEALLEYQAASQRRREWLSVAVSFLVGVLSSGAAALLLDLRRSRSSMEVN